VGKSSFDAYGAGCETLLQTYQPLSADAHSCLALTSAEYTIHSKQKSAFKLLKRRIGVKVSEPTAST
jgi:hypothetical protein